MPRHSAYPAPALCRDLHNRSRFPKASNLTTGESDIGFKCEVRRESVSLCGEPRGGPGVGVFPPESRMMSLSDRRDFCVTKACNLLILDKGKPVARPGRKAKGRRIVSVGRLAAERVKKDRSGN